MKKTDRTRRRFLVKSTALAGLGAFTPYVWSSSYAKEESANDRPHEDFIGDDEARSMLSRSRRKPYTLDV